MPSDKSTSSAKEDRLPLLEVEGLYLATKGFPPEYIKQIQKMEVKPQDVFVVTYPKCGTTWTQYMIWGILHNPKDIVDTTTMFGKYFPFLEMSGPQTAVDLASPRAFKTHIPFRLAPFHSQGKYVVMARNPFDVCVSYYYFLKEMDMCTLVPADFSFDESFECFLRGRIPFGDYFDFIKGWYEQRHNPNVLFLYYEDCKADQVRTIMKLAYFLGSEYLRKLEEDPSVLQRILKLTSFDYMKQNLTFSVPTGTENNGSIGASLKNVNIFRKGKVGDWRSHFTEDQKNRLFDKLYKVIQDKEFRLKLTPTELL